MHPLTMIPLPTTLPAFLFHFMRRYPWRFAIICAFPLAMALESSVMPYFLKRIVDTFQQYEHDRDAATATLRYFILAYGGCWGLMVVLFRTQDYVSAHLVPRFQSDVRLETFAYAQHHSHRFFSDNFAGAMANRLSDLPRSLTALLMFFRWRFLPTVATAICVLAITTRLHPLFSLLLLAWMATHIGLGALTARRVHRLSAENAGLRSALQGEAVDSFANFAVVRLFAQEKREKERLAGASDRERQSNIRLELAMWKVRLRIDAPTLITIFLLLFLLMRYWQQGRIGAGDVVFLMYGWFNLMHWTWQFTTELPAIFGEYGTATQALLLVKEEHEVKDAPGAAALHVDAGRIEFRGVHFRYGKGLPVFEGLAVTIDAGSKVGLVGMSGAGKSSFINLLLRLYDLESGVIAIDGQDISQVSQSSLRRSIAMIPQDPSLFHRPLIENIRYGKPDASDEEVIAAAETAGCHDFIMGLEDGYRTAVGERGVKLSGGQRQRIAIARAVLKDARILVMDEATSALDSVTERLIQERLETVMRGRTTLVIAHRLSTLAKMDRILVLDRGRIVEDGSPETLLKQNGTYARLWASQSDGFVNEKKLQGA